MLLLLFGVALVWEAIRQAKPIIARTARQDGCLVPCKGLGRGRVCGEVRKGCGQLEREGIR
jgi:hypothetical protein